MNSEAAASTVATGEIASGGHKDYPMIALLIGITGLLISAVGLFLAWKNGDSRPLYGWLLGFSYWYSIGIGLLFLTMILNVFDSGWSIIVRRQLEHGLGAIKWLGVIFIPLLIFTWFYTPNTGILWGWMNQENLLPGGATIGEDIIYQAKSGFLNRGFFTIRAIFYFAIFIGLAETLRKCSFSLEKDGDPKWVHINHNTSAIGIFLCAFAATFAAVDWFKSLDYRWFSTMYGVWFFAESMRAALATAVVICTIQASRGALNGLYNRCHSYLLGCLMLAFTIFWAYISFSQYFLIYNANIPEETFWYNIREINIDGSKSSWWWVSMALLFFHFIFPFIFLLWYKNKFGVRILFIAIWILCFHLFDVYWNILPGIIPVDDNILGFVVRPFTITIWDVSTFLGVGGICVWAFLQSAKKVMPIPIRDPRIMESINAHE